MEQYKRILLKEFDSRQKVITELTNLEAILNLPKGTELYISDIHGEFAAFDYILRSCAGILNEKIKDCFGDSLSESHKDRLSALVSYPELVLGEETKGQDWYQEFAGFCRCKIQSVQGQKGLAATVCLYHRGAPL